MPFWYFYNNKVKGSNLLHFSRGVNIMVQKKIAERIIIISNRCHKWLIIPGFNYLEIIGFTSNLQSKDQGFESTTGIRRKLQKTNTIWKFPRFNAVNWMSAFLAIHSSLKLKTWPWQPWGSNAILTTPNPDNQLDILWVSDTLMVALLK